MFNPETLSTFGVWQGKKREYAVRWRGNGLLAPGAGIRRKIAGPVRLRPAVDMERPVDRLVRLRLAADRLKVSWLVRLEVDGARLAVNGGRPEIGGLVRLQLAAGRLGRRAVDGRALRHLQSGLRLRRPKGGAGKVSR